MAIYTKDLARTWPFFSHIFHPRKLRNVAPRAATRDKFLRSAHPPTRVATTAREHLHTHLFYYYRSLAHFSRNTVSLRCGAGKKKKKAPHRKLSARAATYSNESSHYDWKYSRHITLKIDHIVIMMQPPESPVVAKAAGAGTVTHELTFGEFV